MPTDDSFTALILDESNGKVSSRIGELASADLPDGDVMVAVTHSTLNYKDGMIINGLGRMVKHYPHVPGIDFAGYVESSASPLFKEGDPVILTGWRVGETRWGGYATRARVKAEWLVPLPPKLSLSQSMALGTAGFTVMLALMALEEHGLRPDTEAEVLITGAAGGVGSVAIALMAALGYRVAGSTGRADAHGYLRDLGASSIVERSELETPPKGPLGDGRWAGAIDNVGSGTLATILATLSPGGSCAAVGLAAGPELNTTVIPFLLRGVNLLGIDSGLCPSERRQIAWNRLAEELPLDRLDAMTTVSPLGDLPRLGTKILEGRIRGRTVIDLGLS
ncbi:MAG: oxidoreductase [Rhodospirillales bacterium]|nr:oxidoreductase [Rhodospirillales bacterium]